MRDDAGDLLRRVRDEAYHLRVITRQLRNQTKTLASAYAESEQRLEELIDELEQEPHAKEAQGHGRSSIAQQGGMEEAERRGAAQGRAPVGAR